MFVGPQRLLARQQKDVVGSSVGLLAHSTHVLSPLQFFLLGGLRVSKLILILTSTSGN